MLLLIAGACYGAWAFEGAKMVGCLALPLLIVFIACMSGRRPLVRMWVFPGLLLFIAIAPFLKGGHFDIWRISAALVAFGTIMTTWAWDLRDDYWRKNRDRTACYCGTLAVVWCIWTIAAAVGFFNFEELYFQLSRFSIDNFFVPFIVQLLLVVTAVSGVLAVATTAMISVIANQEL